MNLELSNPLAKELGKVVVDYTWSGHFMVKMMRTVLQTNSVQSVKFPKFYPLRRFFSVSEVYYFKSFVD